jgi:hypothetical protein
MTPRTSFIVRFANGLAICICIAWFVFDPGFEPVVTGLLLAAGFLIPLRQASEKGRPSEVAESNPILSLHNERASRPPANPVSLPPENGSRVVSGMSNQPTPALACLEHLRMENIQAPWTEIPPIFSAARYMTDGANVRLGWNIAEVCQGNEGDVPALLDKFAEQEQAVSAKFSLGYHYLAIVAYGGNAGENEELASRVEMICNESNGRRRIRVLIGFMAVNRFVDRVLTGA